jgi:hypothetical protein
MSSPLSDFIVTAWAVTDNGVEGLGPRTVIYLCETEDQANKKKDANVNAAYYSVDKTQAVSMDGLLIETEGEIFNASTGESKGRTARIRADALAKLNAEEKRILGITE